MKAASLVTELAAWSVSTGRGDEGVALFASDTFGATMVKLWTQLWSLWVHGFVYSYFWTSVTIMYFLLRQSEDAVELDVVSLPEDCESKAELPLVGVAASDLPVVERPAEDGKESTESGSEQGSEGEP